MISNPLISIIIPVLNGEKYLERCYSTLTNQKYSNLEIIFVDNGSTDDTVDVIKNFCLKHNNFRLISCFDKGTAFARNKGIESAKGDFISFLDVDDELVANKHQILLQAFSEHPDAGMVVGNTTKRYTDGRTYTLDLGQLKIGINTAPFPGLLWLKYLMVNPTTCSFLIKKDLLQFENKPFAEIPYGEDVAFNVKIGLKNDVVMVNDIVCIYHRHPQSSISLANNQLSRLERYFGFYDEFALPYFFPQKHIKPYNIAYTISESNAYIMLMKLIKVENNKIYKKKIYYLQSKTFVKKLFWRKLLYKTFPYYISTYIYQKLSEKITKYDKHLKG